MPLDSGGVTQLYRSGDMDPADSFAPAEEPSLHYGPDIGAALKAAREFRGLSLQDVSDATRIRRTYLGALEDMRLDELPSRPFTLGYIKAYARHLVSTRKKPCCGSRTPRPIRTSRCEPPSASAASATRAWARS